MLRVARKKAFCNVLGPGKRSVVWFYGCSKRCPGCIAGKMNETDEFESFSPEKLTEWFLDNDGIEGITLSGGEPFEQPIGLLEQFLKQVKENSNFSVLLYTGRQYEELLQDEKNHAILQYIDVLIDGEYRLNEDRGQRWRGSENQRFHFLTSRYDGEREKWFAASGRGIEIELDLNGFMLLSGIPSKNFIAALSTKLGKRDVIANFS